MKFKYKIGLLLLIVSSGCYSYEIGPSIAGFAPVHQALTSNALKCLEDTNGIKPNKCIMSIKRCIDKKGREDISNRKACFQENRPTRTFLSKFTVDDLEKAVKWPDDPTYEAFGPGVSKFGAKMLEGCEKFLQDRKGMDNMSGLLCNTHYGSYQFWHAQSSSIGEPLSETRDKILDWAKFNYEVAVGNIKPDKDYCEYFEENKSSISRYMKPSNYPFCVERKVWGWVPKWLAEPIPAWKIATLYGVSCDNPFTSATACEEELIEYPDKRKDNMVISATGALLHLVQDSFSQSHNERGSCFDGPKKSGKPIAVSKIVCKPISLITNYGQFNLVENHIDTQIDHKLSDDWPYIDDSCINDDDLKVVDDPVTASAKLLWHIERKSDWESEVLVDLTKVFNPIDEGAESGFGACY